MVVIPDDTGSITRIDCDWPQVEQGAIALLALAETRCSLLQFVMGAFLCPCGLLKLRRNVFIFPGPRVFPQQGVSEGLQKIAIQGQPLLGYGTLFAGHLPKPRKFDPSVFCDTFDLR